MDLSEVKSVVRDMLWEWEEDNLDGKECPTCKASCTMVRVSVVSYEGESNKWRCLNCLGLFTGKLEEVV